MLKNLIAASSVLALSIAATSAVAQDTADGFPAAEQQGVPGEFSMDISAPMPGMPSMAGAAGGANPPPSPEELQRQAEEAAFEAALKSMLPMDPSQIRDFKQRLDDSQRAYSAPVGPAPKPSFRSIELTLEPGEQAPTVRMAAGNVSTLTFSDLTGQPWPIETFGVGNPNAFHVQAAGAQQKTNIVAVTPLSVHGASNLMVKLVGNPVPVILTLKAGETEIDYRLDTKILQRGPMAEYDIVSYDALPATGDSIMLAFLDGLPPEAALEMKTSHQDVEAWMFDDMLFVRSRMAMLSPAFVAKSTNVSGVNVYVLPESPVLMFSADGRMRAVSIER